MYKNVKNIIMFHVRYELGNIGQSKKGLCKNKSKI